MLRKGFEPPKFHMNVISNFGGLGDQLARLPAMKWGLEQYPHLSMTIYWQDYFLELAEFLLPAHERLTHQKISDAKYSMRGTVTRFNPDRLTTLGMHLTKHAFDILYDREAPSEKDMFYWEAPRAPVPLHLDFKPEDKVVVFTVAATAPTREWPDYEINMLAEKVNKAGYTSVLIGNTNPIPTGEQFPIKGEISNGIDRSLFIDLTNNTSLLEALGIIQRATAVVGVDNGLLHLACYSSTPMVTGYTSVEAKHRVPFREIGVTLPVEAEIPCYGCQSKLNFVDHDFKLCIFEDYGCTLTMTAKRFEKAFNQINIYL